MPTKGGWNLHVIDSPLVPGQHPPLCKALGEKRFQVINARCKPFLPQAESGCEAGLSHVLALLKEEVVVQSKVASNVWEKMCKAMLQAMLEEKKCKQVFCPRLGQLQKLDGQSGPVKREQAKRHGQGAIWSPWL